MASEIKVNNIKRATGTTITIGESGDSVAVTGNIVKSNALQASDGGNIIDQCGTTVTVGATGDTIALACGASQTGFGRTGTVDWDTASIKTTGFTAVSGNGYFCNTNGGAFTATLPASPTAGDIVAFSDYTRTFATSNLTIGRNSKPMGGVAQDAILSVDGQSATFVFVDDTEGWININETQTSVIGATLYNVQYLNVAGAGGGGANYGAGGGGGGLRTVATKSFQVTEGASYPITIGGGGAGQPTGSGFGACGGVSTFSTITSAGGGGGGHSSCAGKAGGSGGGGGGSSPAGAGGAGNTPPTPCTQGSAGGAGTGPGGGGGGGHSEAGQVAGGGGRGGAGSTNCISGSPLAYAGGGGAYPSGPASPCGTGAPSGGDGTTNKGGGGGGQTPGGVGAGGSGIIILRRLTACSTSTSGTVTTCGSDTIHSFTGDGTFVA
jgi:hypothetical protein